MRQLLATEWPYALHEHRESLEAVPEGEVIEAVEDWNGLAVHLLAH